MHNALILATLGVVIATSCPATANVRAGVDAWSLGDYRKAVAEWRPAAVAGDADAQFNLGQAYALGRGVPVDIAMAESWFRKAALQGHLAAQTKYALVLFDEGKRADAVPWLEKGVANGDPRAQLVLGTMLFNGDAVQKDFPRAYALIVRAAAAGTPKASQVQAQMDQYVSIADRQKGLALARQYEAEARRPALPSGITGPPEITGQATLPMIKTTDLPASSYNPGASVDEPVVQLKPTPKPVVEALKPSRPAPTAVPSGKWRVQLGAFAEVANARKLWSQLAIRFAGRQPEYVRAGTLTRLLVGPYPSRTAAAEACAVARPCVPVAP